MRPEPMCLNIDSVYHILSQNTSAGEMFFHEKKKKRPTVGMCAYGWSQTVRVKENS